MENFGKCYVERNGSKQWQNTNFPMRRPSSGISRCCAAVIVHARLRAYETDPEIADLLDQIENVPDLLARWPDMNQQIVMDGLRGHEKKYLGSHSRFSKILLEGPGDNWQLRWDSAPETASSADSTST